MSRNPENSESSVIDFDSLTEEQAEVLKPLIQGDEIRITSSHSNHLSTLPPLEVIRELHSHNPEAGKLLLKIEENYSKVELKRADNDGKAIVWRGATILIMSGLGFLSMCLIAGFGAYLVLTIAPDDPYAHYRFGIAIALLGPLLYKIIKAIKQK